jgi:hypothetical protein
MNAGCVASAAATAFLASCARTPPPSATTPPGPQVSATSSASASPAASASDHAPAAGPPARARIHFVLQKHATGSERDLVLVSEELDLERAVGTVQESDVCEGRARSPDEVLIGCGAKLLVAVDSLPGRLKVGSGGPQSYGSPLADWGGTDVGVSEGTQLTIDPVPSDPSNVPCTSALVGAAVTVRVDVSPSPNRQLRVRAPSVGFETWIWLSDKESCLGERNDAARTLRITCEGSDATIRGLTLRATDRALFASTFSKGLDGSEIEMPLGGVTIPCGARVDFPAVRLVDPGWSPLFGGKKKRK